MICCSETWLSKDFSDMFVSIPGKSVFRSDRNARGGGVCIYVDSKLAPYCDKMDNFSYCSKDLEIVSINIKKPGLKHMFISSIYRPPRGKIVSCIDRLNEMLSRRDNFKKEIWLMGDFNVDYLDRKDRDLAKFNNMFKVFGLKQLVSDVTRPGRHKSSCIDWIVTNSRFVIEASALDIMVSDHFAVACVRKKIREHVSYVYREKRDYSNYNSKSFTDLLRTKLNLSNYLDIHDPNVLWDLIVTNSRLILEIMCPVRRYKQREKLTPWMVADIYRQIRLRDKLARVFRYTRSNESLCKLRRQRNIVNSAIEAAKRDYIHRILHENTKSPKKFWKLINDLLKGQNSSNEYAQFIDPSTNTPVPLGHEADLFE